MSEHSIHSVLITGGAGFIGSNFVRMMLDERPGARMVNYDALTYAGNLESISDLEQNPNYTFVKGDICDGELLRQTLQAHAVDTIIHFAAESHVDRSILSAAEFVRTNVLGTQCLLEAAMQCGVKRFVMISTDEVYGSLGPDGAFTEETPLAPNSPYSASKAGGDLLCRSYFHTYGFPVIITRCSNNYGPYQFPEKLIPLMIIKAMSGEKLPVYGDGMNVRDWIHVSDHCRAVLAATERGRPGETYNIGGRNEWPNIGIVKELLKILSQPESLISFVKDRPGHDRRYAIDPSKAERELDWKPRIDFAEGLAQTVAWYQSRQPWWQNVMSGEYQQYYEKNYASKMQ
ncbi:dTDP-glucose 4,6-dehydratase [Candidatus Sumerlaeota bacterium]|nr:dTDP-glucose 4,6-dehydratase [Candidatus Sumerlaeota bacterium]